MEEQQFVEGEKVTVRGTGPLMVIDWTKGKLACCLLLVEGRLERKVLPVSELVRAGADESAHVLTRSQEGAPS